MPHPFAPPGHPQSPLYFPPTATHLPAAHSFYDPTAEPVVMACSPSHGESHQGAVVTLHGVNLVADETDGQTAGFVCLFGGLPAKATLSPELNVICRAPLPPSAGEVEVTLSLDGGRHRATSAATFTYFDLLVPPVLESVSPAFSGMLEGGELLTLSGKVRCPVLQCSKCVGRVVGGGEGSEGGTGAGQVPWSFRLWPA